MIMILLDGSHGEGGGQIVRTALALSTLTGKPVKITNIRQGRKDAGLKAQHVQCVKALQQLCGAKADGAEIGSPQLLYIPGPIKAKNIEIDIGTAGSITLLLQAVLLPCMFANKNVKLTIRGGTDTQWSMPIDYFTNVLAPQYRRFCGIEVKLLKRGYYPKGGGQLELRIRPRTKITDFENFEAFRKALSRKAFNLTKQGELITIKGISHASKNLANAKVAERQADSARKELSALSAPIEITAEYTETESKGSGITLWAVFSTDAEDVNAENPIRLGADSLGEPGKPSEKIGAEAANRLLAEIKSKTPVDKHLADNLIPLIALCPPSSFTSSEITNHAKTNADIVNAFLGKTITIQENTIKSNWQA